MDDNNAQAVSELMGVCREIVAVASATYVNGNMSQNGNVTEVGRQAFTLAQSLMFASHDDPFEAQKRAGIILAQFWA